MNIKGLGRLQMLKKAKNTRIRAKHGKRANKNIRHSRKQTKKQNSFQQGGSASYDNQIQTDGKKEKFQVTTFRSINQDDLNRFKISNYVNNNVDYGILPGPPPVDCCIM